MMLDEAVSWLEARARHGFHVHVASHFVSSFAWHIRVGDHGFVGATFTAAVQCARAWFRATEEQDAAELGELIAAKKRGTI